MDTDWLRNFLLTTNQKSLSKASELLNISQPALSKQIKRLEELYGVPLFYRSAHGVTLTEPGALVAERIQSVISDLDSIERDIQPFKGSPLSLTVGTIPSIAAHYLPPRIMESRMQGIDVGIEIQNTSQEVLGLLDDHKVDAAIVEQQQFPKGTWHVALFNEPYLAVLPREHRLAGLQSVTLADLKNELFVMYPKNCDVRKRITEEFAQDGVEVSISMEIPFGESILSFVAAGGGITIAPKLAADHASHLPVVVVPILSVTLRRTVSLYVDSPEHGRQLKKFIADHSLSP